MCSLKKSIKEFADSFGEKFPIETFAILYAPKKCFLGLVNKDGNIEVKDNVDKFNIDKVYEARVFNSEKELRWLSSGETETLTDNCLKKVESFANVIENQKYLLWGQSTGATSGDWTQFAEARIGAFFVPLKNVAEKGYAQFTAIEYLKEFADGNVAVFEERLTGISEVK